MYNKNIANIMAGHVHEDTNACTRSITDGRKCCESAHIALWAVTSCVGG